MNSAEDEVRLLPEEELDEFRKQLISSVLIL